MKTLFVLRHAAASGPGSAPTDFDRPLKPLGQMQALGVGEMMHQRHLDFDAIVASPALRVAETISRVAEAARRRVEPRYDPRAYNASPYTWIDILRAVDDDIEQLLIVGHNPGLQELLLHLAEADRDGLRADVAASYLPATLAQLSLAIDHWRTVGPRSGRIVTLFRPNAGPAHDGQG